MYLNRNGGLLPPVSLFGFELIWLTGRLAPDFKTIATFRQDDGAAIRAVCARSWLDCRVVNEH
jgi:hypothetical protein